VDRAESVVELEEIRAELARLADRLLDLGMGILRETVARGETSRPELERKVSRARTQVARAVALLDAEGRSEE
jgi:hypothetical protein